jgi:hypothetical protein
MTVQKKLDSKRVILDDEKRKMGDDYVWLGYYWKSARKFIPRMPRNNDHFTLLTTVHYLNYVKVRST